MPRHRSSFFVAGALLATGLAIGLLLHYPTAGHAQRGDGPAASLTAREQQFELLAREVDQFQRQANILKTVIKLVSPSVVHIDAERIEALGRSRRGLIEEAGSGVIVDMAGKNYVLTNRHVIKNHNKTDIKIRLYDNHEMHPQQIWSDPDTDIALMLVDGDDLVPARIGNSDQLEIGDAVLAMGSPFGLSRSVTSGIISAKGRRDLKLGEQGVRLQDFLQTDAAINPGNSGGPLINMRGEVVGMNTAIVSNSGGFEGIGFSIPINMVMMVARHLVEKGVVVRAFLGVTYDKDFDAAMAARLGLPRPYGARIEGLTEGGPAEAANLRVDDVILKFNGVPVDDGDHLVNIVSMTEVGKAVPVVVWRGGHEIQLTAKVGDAARFRKSSVVDTPR
ncbi:MAG TPA: trypsin-like peptidase domain-containing protein [Pirellulales bacterium]|nr:trypsin-like peptidase domain-containing protein [Pirellulales bacterium]